MDACKEMLVEILHGKPASISLTDYSGNENTSPLFCRKKSKYALSENI